jgi:hypothetical protein
MANTVATAATRRHSNDLRADLSKVRATSQPPVKAHEVSADRSELLILIRDAARDCNLSQKALAINAGCTESELSDALSGRRNFAATWIWNQPDTFLLRFVELITAARGLTPAAVREVRAARIAELVRLLLTEAA